MAFGKVKNSEEVVTSFKQYIGVAPMKVIAVNPSKDELSAIYGTEIKYEPTYLGETEVDTPKGKAKVAQLRVDFILKSDPEEKDTKDINLITKVSLFLTDSPRYTRNMDKVEVINVYGESAYLDLDSIKNKTLPSNMAWFNTTGMKVALNGEVALTEFLRSYLGISFRTFKDNSTNSWKEIDNVKEAECQLSNARSLFNNIAELRQAINLAPNNLIKVMIGVKNVDGKSYQDVYNRLFLKYGNRSIESFNKSLAEAREYSAYPNTEFKVVKGLEVYDVEATDFTKVEDTNTDPFAAPTSESSDSDLPF